MCLLHSTEALHGNINVLIMCKELNFIKLAFLKDITFTKDFTDTTEFNKCRSQIEAAQNCVMK